MVQIPAQLLPSCATLNKLINLSVFHFPHLLIGNKKYHTLSYSCCSDSCKVPHKYSMNVGSYQDPVPQAVRTAQGPEPTTGPGEGHQEPLRARGYAVSLRSQGSPAGETTVPGSQGTPHPPPLPHQEPGRRLPREGVGVSCSERQSHSVNGGKSDTCVFIAPNSPEKLTRAALPILLF